MSHHAELESSQDTHGDPEETLAGLAFGPANGGGHRLNSATTEHIGQPTQSFQLSHSLPVDGTSRPNQHAMQSQNTQGNQPVLPDQPALTLQPTQAQQSWREILQSNPSALHEAHEYEAMDSLNLNLETGLLGGLPLFLHGEQTTNTAQPHPFIRPVEGTNRPMMRSLAQQREFEHLLEMLPHEENEHDHHREQEETDGGPHRSRRSYRARPRESYPLPSPEGDRRREAAIRPERAGHQHGSPTRNSTSQSRTTRDVSSRREAASDALASDSEPRGLYGDVSNHESDVAASSTDRETFSLDAFHVPGAFSRANSPRRTTSNETSDGVRSLDQATTLPTTLSDMHQRIALEDERIERILQARQRESGTIFERLQSRIQQARTYETMPDVVRRPIEAVLAAMGLIPPFAVRNAYLRERRRALARQIESQDRQGQVTTTNPPAQQPFQQTIQQPAQTSSQPAQPVLGMLATDSIVALANLWTRLEGIMIATDVRMLRREGLWEVYLPYLHDENRLHDGPYLYDEAYLRGEDYPHDEALFTNPRESENWGPPPSLLTSPSPGLANVAGRGNVAGGGGMRVIAEDQDNYDPLMDQPAEDCAPQ